MTDLRTFEQRRSKLMRDHEALVSTANQVDLAWDNGWFERYQRPALTAEHVPPEWRYDFDPKTNPRLLERLGINAVFNPGAIELAKDLCLVCRVEGYDRKSFFAVARSSTGIDQFRFDPEPILLPQTAVPDVNVYDMRLVAHEDGNIYGTFCTERKDPTEHDTSAALAACGIVRTKDLVTWQRLDDLVSRSPQQRNVVLHPEFIDGKYALYTRPQDGFIEAGSGGGIGWALTESMEHAEIAEEKIIEPRVYHTIKESKNGMGPAPIKTERGWLHIAHGVRNTAAGLRYVLYAFLCDLEQPWRVTARPGGYFMAPRREERVGDVSNVLFCNGVVARRDGSVFIYYASSDTRVHVATTSVERLLDYVQGTPPDPLLSHQCVEQRVALIRKNQKLASAR